MSKDRMGIAYLRERTRCPSRTEKTAMSSTRCVDSSMVLPRRLRGIVAMSDLPVGWEERMRFTPGRC
jgi:hypothetical protein